MENNMKLWKAVCTTPEGLTEPVEYGGRKFTAIDTYSRIQAATEQFGPFGEGWGVDNEKFDCDSVPGLCIYTAEMWYNYNGPTENTANSFPIHSAIKMQMWSKKQGKLVTDDDFVKKVATDALTKGLSMLGFNADIYIGHHADSKYVPPKQAKVDDRAEMSNSPRHVIMRVLNAIKTRTGKPWATLWAQVTNGLGDYKKLAQVPAGDIDEIYDRAIILAEECSLDTAPLIGGE